MISRLTTLAAIFAVIATASLAFAASSHGVGPAASAAAQLRVVQLEPVVIVAQRRPQ